jgi:hypothetical protein
VHRHPPFNGLGSNTCIQDSFNLSWKIAYVESGRASRSLLASYSVERQPVGRSVITRANDGFREHAKVWEEIGILPEDISERKAILEELRSPTLAGQKRRKAIQAATLNTCHEFHGLGIEMNQIYSGTGVYTADEKIPFRLRGPAAEDSILYHSRSTYPGHRVLHAWLNKRKPIRAPVSTIDLAGKGNFTIFTGIGGEAWRAAAETVTKTLGHGLHIRVFSIGPGQEWEDVYNDWTSVRGVEEPGAVLVRPDRFIAWRSPEMILSEVNCAEKLSQVMRAVLGRAVLGQAKMRKSQDLAENLS